MAHQKGGTRAIPHPEAADFTLQAILEAVADPVRRSIVRQLAQASDGTMSCGGFDVAVSRSTSTHHFNVLRDAGVIRQYYVGTTKLNTLRHADLEKRYPGLLDSVVASSIRELVDAEG
jgi:DNA-binding transcriptional ArsR family regulator